MSVIKYRSGHPFRIVKFETLPTMHVPDYLFMKLDDRVGGVSESAPGWIITTEIITELPDSLMFAHAAVSFLREGSLNLNGQYSPTQNVFVLLKSMDHATNQVVVKIDKGIAYVYASQLFYFWWKNQQEPRRIPFLNSDGSFWTQCASVDRLAQKIYRKMFISLEEIGLVLCNGRHREFQCEFKVVQPFMPSFHKRDDHVEIVVMEEEYLEYIITVKDDLVVSYAARIDNHRAVLSAAKQICLFKNENDVIEVFTPPPFKILGLSTLIAEKLGCFNYAETDEDTELYSLFNVDDAEEV